jgi:hypothetical protein
LVFRRSVDTATCPPLAGGRDYGSGCGGFSTQRGDVELSWGHVDLTAGRSTGGIGTSFTGALDSVTIDGGTVTATGNAGGSGIGGGGDGGGSVGTVTISGGTVSATGNGNGAGIGGGAGESGADVTIGTGAQVTVSASAGTSVIGGSTGFGSLSNAGSLTIPSGATLTVPAGIAVTNTGTLIDAGTLAVDGSVSNPGAIVDTGTVTPPDSVAINDYLLTFDANGGSGSRVACRCTRRRSPTPTSPCLWPCRPGPGRVQLHRLVHQRGRYWRCALRFDRPGRRQRPTTLTFFAGWASTQPTATTLTGTPLLWTLFAPSATLTATATGAPIAGQTVTFSAGGQVVCSAMTNPDGVATCSGVVVISLETVVATYAGNSTDQPAATTVPLL